MQRLAGHGDKVANGATGSRALPGGDVVLAAEQADFLRGVYDGIENFRDAMGFLFSGFFRGYAHLEKHFTLFNVVLQPTRTTIRLVHIAFLIFCASNVM